VFLAAGTRACDEGAELRPSKSMTAVSVSSGNCRRPGVLYMRETLRLDADDPLIRLRAEIELTCLIQRRKGVYFRFFQSRSMRDGKPAFDSCGHLDKAG